MPCTMQTNMVTANSRNVLVFESNFKVFLLVPETNVLVLTLQDQDNHDHV